MPDGDTELSAQGQTTSGQATLDGTNYSIVNQPTLPHGAIGWRVIHSQSGGTPAGVGVDISGVLAVSTTAFDDTGITGSAYTAVTQDRPAVAETRTAVVRVGENEIWFTSGELRYVDAELVAAVTSKLQAAFPARSITAPPGAQ